MAFIYSAFTLFGRCFYSFQLEKSWNFCCVELFLICLCPPQFDAVFRESERDGVFQIYHSDSWSSRCKIFTSINNSVSSHVYWFLQNAIEETILTDGVKCWTGEYMHMNVVGASKFPACSFTRWSREAYGRSEWDIPWLRWNGHAAGFWWRKLSDGKNNLDRSSLVDWLRESLTKCFSTFVTIWLFGSTVLRIQPVWPFNWHTRAEVTHHFMKEYTQIRSI